MDLGIRGRKALLCGASRGLGKAAAMAGLRDTALKLAKAVSDGKLDEAKALAGEVTPAGKAGAATQPGPVAVTEPFEIDTLMQVFKPERGGGL